VACSPSLIHCGQLLNGFGIVNPERFCLVNLRSTEPRGREYNTSPKIEN
jgi:hypothetical protein